MFSKLNAEEEKIKEKIKEKQKQINKDVPMLKKITEEQKREYLEKAGRTTILREIARNLKRIKRNMDLVLGLLTVFFAIITGLMLGYKEYIITIVPAIITLVLGIVTYTLPSGDLKDAVDNFQETIQKRR